MSQSATVLKQLHIDSVYLSNSPVGWRSWEIGQENGPGAEGGESPSRISIAQLETGQSLLPH
jgi:hypothetical protein